LDNKARFVGDWKSRRENETNMNIEHVKGLIAQHGSNFAFVINHSGGKDSTRALGFICENFPTAKKYVVMADTGFEHIKPISAADFARNVAALFDLELDVVEPIWKEGSEAEAKYGSRKTYLDMVDNRGKFPAPGLRQCTSDLKRAPIQKYIRALSERVIVSVE